LFLFSFLMSTFKTQGSRSSGLNAKVVPSKAG